ncbi:MAG TPA: electron transfer flavoprotein, partial [Mycobacteriales bacterium]
LPRTAARLGVGMTGDVVGLDTDPHPGDNTVLDLVWLKPAWAGSALARVVARTVPSVGTLRPGSAPVPARRPVVVDGTDPAGVVEIVDAAEVAELSELGATGTLLDSGSDGGGLAEAARVLVCLGGGTGAAAAGSARELVARRGWELAGTPAAARAGLVPPSREMAVARRSVSPALVVAVDVVEPAELDALRGAGTLVTVGPDGLVHELADLAVVTDSESVLRRMVEVAPPEG